MLIRSCSGWAGKVPGEERCLKFRVRVLLFSTDFARAGLAKGTVPLITWLSDDPHKNFMGKSSLRMPLKIERVSLPNWVFISVIVLLAILILAGIPLSLIVHEETVIL